MLDAADVLVHRKPAVHLLGREGRAFVMRVGVAQVVPAGTREGIHGVGFALGRAAAHGARRVDELLVRGQRLACGKVDVLGQAHRQVLFRHGHQAALRAMDGRDGVAPVALTADEPVAQAELHLASPQPARLQVGHNGIHRRGVLTARHAGVCARLHQNALGIVGVVPVHRGHAPLLHAFQLREQRVVLA